MNGESTFWVIRASGFIFQESGDCFLFMKTKLEMIETLQTVCTILSKFRTLTVEVSRSTDGLPKFGTQVNILADDKDIKFYNQGFFVSFH